MVSLATLKKLQEQTAEIERKAGTKPFKCVFIRYGDPFDKDAVAARHYEMFPEDRDPDACFLTVYAATLGGSPVECFDETRQTAAWRSLVSERGMAA